LTNRRQAKRVSGNAKVSVRHAVSKTKLAVDARLRNIGKHGFALISEDQLVRGINYHFQLDFLGRIIELTGKVIHVRNMGTYFRYGVRIQSLPLLSRIRLNRFLAANSVSIQVLFLVYSLIGAALAWGALNFFLGITGPGTTTVFFLTWILLFIFPPF